MDVGACLLSAEWLATIWPTTEKEIGRRKLQQQKKIRFFFQRQTVQQDVYLLTKKSMFVTVKTNPTCYGLESHYPPTRIFIRITWRCLSLPCNHFILPFPLSLPFFFSCFFIIIIVRVIIRIHIAWPETTDDAATEISLSV